MHDVLLMALTGGVSIGLSSILLMILLGRIAGISGIVSTAVKTPFDNLWAVVFLVGLCVGAFGFHFLTNNPIPVFKVPIPLLISGGFIVGVGTRLGSGCTSGHGICGIGRLSMRSIVATCTFMMFGFMTVYVRLHGGVA